MIGTCCLCQSEKQLIRKSHIIPDFMYRDLYDSKHRIFFLNIDASKHKLVRKSFRFTGEYQSDILCKNCDNFILGGLEDYGCKFLYGENLSNSEQLVMKNLKPSLGLIHTEIANVSYTKLKLFLLSLMWRCSISDRDGFKKINLELHEGAIRKMISDSNAGTWDQFPVFIMTYLNDKQLPRDLIAHPQK